MKTLFFKKLAAVISAAVVAMAVVPIVGVQPLMVQAGTIKVTYGQTEARSILDMINSLRTGGNAWYWNESDTEKVYNNSLSALKYDEGLEQAAMQRAAEIAVSYSHTRPDGSRCVTVVTDAGGSYMAYGENIAYGYSSASSVNTAWAEENDSYSGQGHRRNMLSKNFSYVGIGHAVRGGTDYWVEEFADQPQNISYSLSDGVAAIEEKGELNVRVFSSLDAMKTDDADIENGKSWMNSDMFRLNALKSFLDGTGAGHTAFMLKPYKGTDNYGNSYRTSEQLRSFIKRASEHGLATHFHACGDAAVRQAVEAYEWATDNEIRLDERSSIEHLDTALLSDVQRTVKLGITLNMTPDFLAPTKHWKDNPYIGIYDEDVENEELFSLGSFIDTGVNVSFGTDGTASSMNPMDQLFRAVTRVANDYKPEGGFRPVEAISIEDAIYHYTIGSARTVGMEDRLGSIEEGKYADMIVMDTDLLTASPAEIKAAKPVMTISDGRIVYKNF